MPEDTGLPAAELRDPDAPGPSAEEAVAPSQVGVTPVAAEPEAVTEATPAEYTDPEPTGPVVWASLADLREQLADQTKSAASLSELVSSLQSQNTDLKAQLEGAMAQRDTALAQLSEARARLSVALGDIHQLNNSPLADLSVQVPAPDAAPISGDAQEPVTAPTETAPAYVAHTCNQGHPCRCSLDFSHGCSSDTLVNGVHNA